MQHFSLFARGESFDVTAFLGAVPLGVDRMWRRGEKIRPDESDDCYVNSGLEKSLGDGATIPFEDQQQLAIEFIAQHREDLRTMVAYPGVELCEIRLQYQFPLMDNTIAFPVTVSPEMNWHALDAGLEVSTMIVLERDLGWTKFPFDMPNQRQA